ncbi:hypothetical protein MQC88_11415 [Luteimonas sp. 50]|uniref:Chemotaxis protein n=1 Tax=Cognatiluteimonas sedimenti TaxID=2927791 RepID=A0ABT0A6G3_9GAMM|nr:hypothetical protein [Lysobacter sedimenti]MCJ0826551.1 hypothetical protein [Lysobacter sedimenti]
MKALVRDYLASLRERDELDAVLPELLGELGFHVFSRPGRGTHQLGVDVAAIGKGDDGKDAVFLFSVKPGNLTRQDWMNDTPQALKYSLEEALQVYVRNRLPVQYRKLNVVICIVIGGEVHEHMREHLRAFIEQHESDRISFQEWDGDHLAELVLRGLLREEILPAELRSSFRKAIAMLDAPEVSIQHFTHLVRSLLGMDKSQKARLRVARQLNICTWILYVWARSIDNIETPYRASELTLLCTWELVRRSINSKGAPDKSLDGVLRHTIELHLNIARAFVDKITPHVNVMHGVSAATESRSALDVNLALFEVLGRIGLWGLWMHWLHSNAAEGADVYRGNIDNAVATGIKLIRNNPALLLPATDQQTTDIALFLQLWLAESMDLAPVREWLGEMTGRLNYTVRTRGRYPSCSTDYAELDNHQSNRQDDEYFNEATAGSTLIPLTAAWLHALGETEAFDALAKLVKEKLDHCTLQLWFPDESSEPALYIGGEQHGRALTGLSLVHGGEALLTTIAEACNRTDSFQKLSPMNFGFWPIILVACHYYRLPIPPNLWIYPLLPQEHSSLPPAKKSPAKRKHPAKTAVSGVKRGANKATAERKSPSQQEVMRLTKETTVPVARKAPAKKKVPAKTRPRARDTSP